ncbi:MAG: PKD domain-containing protein [Candidatus Bathyarchaeia archaeon]|jgi:hypothetical protein
MKKLKKLQVIIIVLLFISLTICTLVNFQVKAQSAAIWADKADYHPGETVTIYGTGFLPNANVAINVTKQSDGTVSSFNVISDSNGNFTTSYQIGNVGATLYTVTATDGTNTATTTFTDSTFGIDTNCEGFGSISRSQSVPITTTSMTAQANELIIIVITQGNLGPRTFEHFTITDSFSSHLSYTQRGTTLRSVRNGEAISEYYAVTSSSQTGSFRITVIPHRYNRENIDVQVFGILGANTASPFDSHSGLPYTSYSKGRSIPTVRRVSTSNANDIILGLEGNSGSTAETAGSYFTGTILHNVNREGNNVGYKTVTSTLSRSSIAFGTRVTNWVMYVDAVRQALSVSVSPTSWTIDMGQSKTFTATPSGGSGSYTRYQWYVCEVAQSGATASTFSYSPASAGSHSITVTVTDSLDVTSPQSTGVTVTVNSALVAPTASASAGTIDLGQTSALTSTAVLTGTSPYTYQWLQKAPGAGSYSPISDATSSGYSFVTSGSTTIGSWSFELQVTDNASAPVVVTSTAVSVLVNAAPTVSVSPTSWTMDVGQSKTFTATASGGSASYTSYQWYVDGLLAQSGTASVMPFTPGSSGSYLITVTVTDSLGVTSALSSAASVTVAASPTVSVAPIGPLTMDAGQVQAFTATASGGSGTINYQWYLDSSAVGSNSASYSYTASAGLHSVTCKVTDSASTPVTSPASNVVSVTVNSALAAPTVTTTPGTVDQGQTSSLASTAVSTGTSPYTYQWFEKAPGGSYVMVGSNSGSFSFATSGSTVAGSWSFILEVTDNVGAAVNSTAVSVAVNAAPSVTVSPTSWTMDVGQSKIFTATPSGGSGSYTSYQWYVNGSAQSGQTALTFSYSPASSGAYSVTVTVTDSLGATSAQSTAATVTVNSALAAPTVTPTPDTVDQGQTSSLTSTAVSTGTSPYTYQWFEKASGGSYVTVGSNSGSFSFVTSGSTATGSWSFILEVTDNVGAAVNSTAVSVAVNVAPTVSIAPVGPVTLDAGQAQTFTASASGGTGTLTYQWYLNGSPVGVDSNTYIFSGSAGSYSVTCTVTDSAFVPASAASNAVSVTVNQLTITVTQGANGVIAPGTITVNYGGSQTFTITPNTGYYIASLSVDGSPVTAASSYTFSNIQASHTITATFAINTYTITVTQGANGVIAPGTITVDYGATPSFSITPNTGYHIASITVDGASVAVTSPSGQTYQFSAVSADGSLTATFAITTSTTPKGSSPSPTPTVSSSSPTPTVSSSSPTPTVSSSSPTPTVSPPSPTPLYLVLAAVIIVAAIIILIFSVIAIKRRRRKLDSTLPNPENKYTKTNVLAANEEQEIASLKGKIEKINNLEAEKKKLLLEIEKLKKKG